MFFQFVKLKQLGYSNNMPISKATPKQRKPFILKPLQQTNNSMQDRVIPTNKKNRNGFIIIEKIHNAENITNKAGSVKEIICKIYLGYRCIFISTIWLNFITLSKGQKEGNS